MDRRNFFLTTAAAAAASTTVFGSPSDTIRVATIGLRGRGKDHIKEITGQPNVELVALCDIDQKVLDTAARNVETITKKKPSIYTDYRKLLEDKSIDAISIATPNHWHTLMTIDACRAGKDVYVENARLPQALRSPRKTVVGRACSDRPGDLSHICHI